MLKLRAGVLISLLLLFALGIGHAVEKPKVDPKLARTYERLASEVKTSELSRTIKTLSTLGSRVAGYPGGDAAQKYVLEQFKKIGLEDVKAEPFSMTIPVDEGASLKVGGRSYRLHPLWPNLVRTSQLPKGGLTGQLI